MTIAREHVHCCRRVADFASAEAVDHYPPDRGLTSAHVDLALAVDLATRTCVGAVTHTVQAQRAGARSIRLDAVGFADVSVEGAGLRWSYDGEVIAVAWTEPFAAGESRAVAVRYRVVEPASGLLFSGPSEISPAAPWLAATDNETERARHWFPCVDHPSVRPTLSFHLRAAAGFTCLANGALVGADSHEDGTVTTHWRLDQGCPSYLTCFVIGELVRCDDGEVDGAPIAYFAPRPFTAEDLRRSFGRTAAMLRWMIDRLGVPFPFPKYFQFAAPGIGGAMENISLVSWDDMFVLDEALAQEWGRLVDQINAHEMAHSYFGDLVVIRDFADAWLKESWATYMEACWIEHAYGAEEYAYEIYECAQRYLHEADERYLRPIVTRRFDSSWQLFDAHLYPGGAVRLHMLRRLLGDEVFWPAVRDYLLAHSGGLADTDDLRKAFEARSGRSLARFFDEWLRSPGYPKLKASFSYDPGRGEGCFELEQTQADPKAGIPCFELDVEVAWTIGGVESRQVVALRGAKRSFTAAMKGDPEAVRIDPEQKLLCALEFNPGEPRLRAQLRGGDVIGRIVAGKTLAKTGTRANVEAIAAAWATEPFWGVRVEWARALADSGALAAGPAMAEMVARERDPLVLEPLLRAAASLREPAVVAAIEARLAAGLPYRASQAAYEAMGALRERLPAAGLARLIEASAREGFGGIVAAGALRGLAASRAPEAAAILTARTRTPQEGGTLGDRARPAAALALGQLARVLERREREAAIERLCALLRDPAPRVREAAVQGLSAAGAVEAAEAIEAYAAGLAAQYRVGARRVASSLRQAAAGARFGAGEAQLTALQEKVRRLEDELGRLRDRVDAQEGRER